MVSMWTERVWWGKKRHSRLEQFTQFGEYLVYGLSDERACRMCKKVLARRINVYNTFLGIHDQDYVAYALD